MTLVLTASLVYYNFFDKEKVLTPPPIGGIEDTDKEYGSLVGEYCYGYDIPLLDENGYTGETFNPAKNTGKITVINFWGTWCGPCKAELPYFDQIAREYVDTVTVIAISTVFGSEDAPAYIAKNFAGSPIVWGCDVNLEGQSVDYYYTLVGGMDTYPMTVVLDQNGVIVYSDVVPLEYEELKEIIESIPAV